MLKNYLFKDITSGEEFICQAPDIVTAEQILTLEGIFNMENVRFVTFLSHYEAEMSGLDVY